MKVALAILNFNGLEWLPGLLTSIARSDAANCPIYLIDNASSDDSIAYVRKTWPDVTVIRNDCNLGYSAAYNRVLPTLFESFDWVCLMNTDTLVSKCWLTPVGDVVHRHRRIGIAGPGFAAWDSENASQFMLARSPLAAGELGVSDSQPVDVDWVEGSIMFISRDCYQQVGGLNEVFFMYWEDADICRTARMLGWRIVVIPASVCRHFESGSSASEHPLKLQNHLVFVLINPTSGILWNLLRMFRLVLTYSKKSLLERDRSLASLIRAFAKVVCKSRTYVSIWRNLRCRAATP